MTVRHSVIRAACTSTTVTSHWKWILDWKQQASITQFRDWATENRHWRCFANRPHSFISCLKVRWPSVPNFSEQSRILRICPEKKLRLFGMLKCPEFRTMYQICPDLTSWCVAVDQNNYNTYNEFIVVKMHSVQLKMHQSIFVQGSAPDHAGGA